MRPAAGRSQARVVGLGPPEPEAHVHLAQERGGQVSPPRASRSPARRRTRPAPGGCAPGAGASRAPGRCPAASSTTRAGPTAPSAARQLAQEAQRSGLVPAFRCARASASARSTVGSAPPPARPARPLAQVGGPGAGGAIHAVSAERPPPRGAHAFLRAPDSARPAETRRRAEQRSEAGPRQTSRLRPSPRPRAGHCPGPGAAARARRARHGLGELVLRRLARPLGFSARVAASANSPISARVHAMKARAVAERRRRPARRRACSRGLPRSRAGVDGATVHALAQIGLAQALRRDGREGAVARVPRWPAPAGGLDGPVGLATISSPGSCTRRSARAAAGRRASGHASASWSVSSMRASSPSGERVAEVEAEVDALLVALRLGRQVRERVQRLLEAGHGLAVGRARHGLGAGLAEVGDGLVPHLAAQGVVGQPLDLLGQPVRRRAPRWPRRCGRAARAAAPGAGCRRPPRGSARA